MHSAVLPSFYVDKRPIFCSSRLYTTFVLFFAADMFTDLFDICQLIPFLCNNVALCATKPQAGTARTEEVVPETNYNFMENMKLFIALAYQLTHVSEVRKIEFKIIRHYSKFYNKNMERRAFFVQFIMYRFHSIISV